MLLLSLFLIVQAFPLRVLSEGEENTDVNTDIKYDYETINSNSQGEVTDTIIIKIMHTLINFEKYNGIKVLIIGDTILVISIFQHQNIRKIRICRQ